MHQKQMELMKKDLDGGYSKVISEFQREQTRLQTLYEQLKLQLSEAQQTIEQLKGNLQALKTNPAHEELKASEGRLSQEVDQKNHLELLLKQSDERLA